MTRFFYPASRAQHAFCMAIDHGMQFKMRNGFWTLEGLAGMDRSGSYQIEVAEESLRLLQPQVDDVCLVREEGEEPDIYTYLFDLDLVARGIQRVLQIIQRNGIAFHWPESDAA